MSRARSEPTVIARTIDWGPLGLTTLATTVGIAVVGAIDAAPNRVGMIAGLGQAAIALGTGWLVEDDAAELTAPTPTSLRRRVLDRLLVGGAAALIALVLVTVVAVTIAPELRSELVTTSNAVRLAAAAVGVVALAFMLVRRAVPYPALVAASSLVAGYVAWRMVSSEPEATTATWALLAVATGVVGFAASREPLPR